MAFITENQFINFNLRFNKYVKPARIYPAMATRSPNFHGQFPITCADQLCL